MHTLYALSLSIAMNIPYLDANQQRVTTSTPQTIGIAGAHGNLGRELVQQTLNRGCKPIAFVRRDEYIYPPTPYGSLSALERASDPFMNIDMFMTTDLPSKLPYMDAVVFCMSGQPFTVDTSTEVVSDVCSKLHDNTRVCLISAWGVGDSIKQSNAGIKAMRNWYLRSTYSEKEKQESLVSEFAHHLILRPKVLSFASIPMNTISTTRYDLARNVLNWCNETP